jgi:transcriptional regulator with XRE-family HTH domain
MPRRALTIDGDRVREHRERLALDQAEFSRRCGISQPFLSRIESGQRNPSPRLMKNIARELKVRLDDIVNVAARPEPEPEPEAVNQ